MVKSIYELELHEQTIIENRWMVKRVPGGWIYYRESELEYDNAAALSSTSVFVPFNDEFNPEFTL